MEPPEEKKEVGENRVSNTYSGHHYWGGKLLGLLGAVFLVLIVIGIISAAAFHFRRGGVVYHQAFFSGRAGGVMMYDRAGDMMGYGYGGNLTNEQQLSGVVTAVSGGNLTVAGGGAANTVQTDSNTQYYNSKKPAVNDTVLIYGTTNNGTFTATQIVVQ